MFIIDLSDFFFFLVSTSPVAMNQKVQ